MNHSRRLGTPIDLGNVTNKPQGQLIKFRWTVNSVLTKKKKKKEKREKSWGKINTCVTSFLCSGLNFAGGLHYTSPIQSAVSGSHARDVNPLFKFQFFIQTMHSLSLAFPLTFIWKNSLFMLIAFRGGGNSMTLITIKQRLTPAAMKFESLSVH